MSDEMIKKLDVSWYRKLAELEKEGWYDYGCAPGLNSGYSSKGPVWSYWSILEREVEGEDEWWVEMNLYEDTGEITFGDFTG